MTGYRRYWKVRKCMREKYGDLFTASMALYAACADNSVEKFILLEQPGAMAWWVLNLSGYREWIRETFRGTEIVIFRGTLHELRTLGKAVPIEIL